MNLTCECDEQDDQTCAHAPDPCFAEAKVALDGFSACVPCFRAHYPALAKES